MAQHFIDIDDRKIAYHREGEGASVLLIHGVASYSFIWKPIIRELSRNYDVIALDLLGCGDSEKPVDQDLSIKVQSELISKLIDKLGIKDVHLVGHDVGGGVAQLLAVNHADQLSDLTLINPVGYDYWPVQPITAMRLPVIRALTTAIMNKNMLRMVIRRALFYKERLDDKLMDEFWRPLASDEGKRGFVQLIRGINNKLLLDIKDKLKTIELPALLIRGDADAYLSRHILERLHDDIPNSKLVRTPRGGHFIQFDEPEWVSAQIREFISDGLR